MSYKFSLTTVDEKTATVEVSESLPEAVTIAAPLTAENTTVEASIDPELVGSTIVGHGLPEGTTITSVSESSFLLSEYPTRDIKKANMSIERRLPANVIASIRIDLSEIRDRTNVRTTITAGEAQKTTFLVT